VGDANKFEDEEVRLESMHNLLNLAGFQPDMYIDWVDEAHELLRKLAISIQNMDGAAPGILLEAFNDLGVSMAIMTYFKVRIPSNA
jgi:ubiquitin thioesterase protein OTUB1